MPNADDAGAFPSAKLRDFIRGEIRENTDLYPHTGLAPSGSDAVALLSFVESVYDPAEDGRLPSRFEDSRAAETVRRMAATDHVGGAVQDLPSFAVGLTETEVDVSEARAFSRIANSLLNEGAPYNALVFGGMNRGKTGFAGLWLELWRELVPLKYGRNDPVVISNMRTLEAADYVVTDIQEFKLLIFGDAEYVDTGGEKGTPPILDHETPKWWHFDECSTHLDARTFAYEVTNQYLPLVKRFAKVRLDGIHLGHSGMDIHADMRRSNIATEFIFKTSLKSAEVFERMFEDGGAGLKYVLKEVPETSIEYDPDDFSPWSWG